MVAWLLKCNLELDFHELHRNFKILDKLCISYSTHTFDIIRMPISYSRMGSFDISSIHHYFIVLGLQRLKKKDHQKKILELNIFIIDQFYLLISLGVLSSESNLVQSQILGRPPT